MLKLAGFGKVNRMSQDVHLGGSLLSQPVEHDTDRALGAGALTFGYFMTPALSMR